MAVSVLEALQNAQFNLKNLARMPALLPLVQAQINNAVILLEKGYSIEDEVETLIEQYGGIENVPYKEDN